MKISKGVRWALLTAVISGISIFANKFGVGVVKPVLLYTTLKNTMVGLVILSLIVVTRKFDEIRKLKKSEWMKLLLIGLIGGSLPFYLFFEGLVNTFAINAAMIHKSLVLWVAILAYPFLKEKLTRNQILAVMMLYSTNLLLGGFSGFAFDKGELMVLGATLFWAVENVIAKKTLKTVSADVVTLFRMGFGAMVLWGISLVSGVSMAPLSAISFMDWSVLLVVSGLLLGYVWTWYRALKAEKAVVVSAVLVSSTIVTNILSSIFITHKFSGNVLMQLALIALGVLVFIREERVKKLVLK